MTKYRSIKMRIHPVFWFVFGAGIITGHFWEVVTVFFIVVVHELGHTSAAIYYKWRISEIELLPFGGVAKVQEFGNKPLKEELIVTLAGPIQHIWLPVFSYCLTLTDFWNAANHTMFLEKNIMILLFNLLPVWPLDGGKLLHLFLSKSFPFKAAYRLTLIHSCCIIGGLSILFLSLFSFSLNYLIITCFIVFVILKEWQNRNYVFMRFLIDCWRQSESKNGRCRRIVVTPNMPLVKIFDSFYRGASHLVIVKNTQQEIKINEKDLLEAFFKGNHHNRAVGEWLNYVS